MNKSQGERSVYKTYSGHRALGQGWIGEPRNATEVIGQGSQRVKTVRWGAGEEQARSPFERALGELGVEWIAPHRNAHFPAHGLPDNVAARKYSTPFRKHRQIQSKTLPSLSRGFGGFRQPRYN